MALIDLAIVQAGVGAGIVAATRVLDLEPGQATYETKHEPIRIHNAGSLASSHRTEPGARSGVVSIKDAMLSFEDLPWFLNGISTAVTTPTSIGAGSAIASSSVAAASVITTTPDHGLVSGDTVTISGHTGSTPAVDGTYVATVTGLKTFTIPLNVSTGGTGGVVQTRDRLWTNTPTDATAAVDSRYTLEVAARDTAPAEYQLSSCALRKFVIKGKPGDLWRYDAEFDVGLEVIAAKTAALTPRTLTHIPVGGTVLSIDSASAFGTTPRTGIVDGFEISLEDGKSVLRGLGHASDARWPGSLATTKRRNVTGKITAEWNAATERTAWIAGTAQRVRLYKQGAVLGSSYYKVTLDIGGTWDMIGAGDLDGLIMSELELGAQYDAAIAADWKCATVNELGILV